MSVRLLAVDLDGTLLTSNRTIHPENRLAVDRARRAGILVVIATGRIFSSMRPFAAELDLSGPFICCNGGHVVDAGVELLHQGVDKRVLLLVREYCLAHRVHLNVYARTELFFLFESPWSELYRLRAGNLEPTLLDDGYLDAIEPTKLLLIDEPANIAKHAAQLREILRDHPFRFTESEPEYLDIMAPGANKGSALRKVAELRGIDRTNIAAIGDYHNDLEMIRYAGVSAAIGNAVWDVKEAANSVVSSNDQAGVARFIDSLMLNGRE